MYLQLKNKIKIDHLLNSSTVKVFQVGIIINLLAFYVSPMHSPEHLSSEKLCKRLHLCELGDEQRSTFLCCNGKGQQWGHS